jgi:hypothetical protein
MLIFFGNPSWSEIRPCLQASANHENGIWVKVRKVGWHRSPNLLTDDFCGLENIYERDRQG